VRAVTGSESVADAYAAVGADPVIVHTRSFPSVGAALDVGRSCDGFDVVHSHDRRSGLWTLGWPRAGRGTRRPARIHTLHGLPDAYLPLPDRATSRASVRDHVAYRIVEGRLMGRADAVAVPSAATLDLARRLGYRMERAVIVRNGTDVSPQPGPVGGSIGMLTSLEPVKGVDVFLRTARLVHDDDPTTRFVIFGTGSLREALEETANQLGIAEVVRFAGRAPAAVALAQMRVLVVTSHFETSPLVVLEAMAAGVPVVATRVGGIPELAPADAMLLVPPNDPSATAKAIRSKVSDDELTRGRLQRARSHVATERSATATMRAVHALYQTALVRARR
jgi:glycosyltransferase involved in cell wall biosynthesis